MLRAEYDLVTQYSLQNVRGICGCDLLQLHDHKQNIISLPIGACIPSVEYVCFQAVCRICYSSPLESLGDVQDILLFPAAVSLPCAGYVSVASCSLLAARL